MAGFYAATRSGPMPPPRGRLFHRSVHPAYHKRQAARLRELAATATTAPVKAHLLQEAEEHERMARGELVLAFTGE